MKLSVIIPVYNEEATVIELINRVKKVKLNKVEKEIIVVDDGSIDKTSKLLESIKSIKIISYERNKGKGFAVRTGVNKATGDILLIQDADLEYDPNDYAKLLKPILEKKTKVVYGSRLKKYPLVFTGKNKTPLPFHLVANKLLTALTNLLYGSKLTDMETCYKVFTKEVARSIKLMSNGFEIEPELTAKILKKGNKIYEVSIKVSPRGYTEGKKITWRDGLKAIYYLIYYRFIN